MKYLVEFSESEKDWFNSKFAQGRRHLDRDKYPGITNERRLRRSGRYQALTVHGLCTELQEGQHGARARSAGQRRCAQLGWAP